MSYQHRTIVVDGLTTHFLEAGEGDPVVLLHGGEFGVSAEIGWERLIPALSPHYRVVAPDQLMEAAMELARVLHSKPAEALALGKALFYRQLEETISDAYVDASQTIAGNMDSDVAREGVDAFFDKRTPRWKD